MRKIFFAVSIAATLLLSACLSPEESIDMPAVPDDSVTREGQDQEPPQSQGPLSGFLIDELSPEQIAEQLNCEVLEPALAPREELDTFKSRSAEMNNVVDPYDAEDFLSGNLSWLQSAEANDEFLKSVDQILGPELERLVDENLNISSSELMEKFPDTFAAYENQIRTLATDACGFSEAFAEFDQTTKEYDVARSGIIRKAGNAPWYPKGYEELTSSVAYQSLDPSQMNCGYSSLHYCYQAKFMAKTQCNLFVEVSFLKDDLRVDDGIDSAYVGPSSPALLSFTSFDSPRYAGVGTVRIEDITCF